jgi:hypothetical protein
MVLPPTLTRAHKGGGDYERCAATAVAALLNSPAPLMGAGWGGGETFKRASLVP